MSLEHCFIPGRGEKNPWGIFVVKSSVVTGWEEIHKPDLICEHFQTGLLVRHSVALPFSLYVCSNLLPSIHVCWKPCTVAGLWGVVLVSTCQNMRTVWWLVQVNLNWEPLIVFNVRIVITIRIKTKSPKQTKNGWLGLFHFYDIAALPSDLVCTWFQSLS